MLGGLEPVIIFQFSKKLVDLGVSDELAKIPFVADIPTLVDQPPIPVYLSEQQFGILVESESKNVDIDTDTQSTSDGEEPIETQKTVGAVVSINLTARKDSVGLMLLSALIDLIYEKVTSKEYAITYLHGATTVFRGLLHSYSVEQDADSDLMRIKIDISKGKKQPEPKPTVPIVGKTTAVVPIN